MHSTIEQSASLSDTRRGGCVLIGSFIEDYAEVLLRDSDFREAANSANQAEQEAALARLIERGISVTDINKRLERERRIHSARMRGTIR